MFRSDQYALVGFYKILCRKNDIKSEVQQKIWYGCILNRFTITFTFSRMYSILLRMVCTNYCSDYFKKGKEVCRERANFQASHVLGWDHHHNYLR